MTSIEVKLARDDPRWDGVLNLLQAGFSLQAPEGLSARAFMREVLRFPEDYIEGAVSTVFLDGKPVDDIDRAILVDGSRLALSAAMPGLVGAMMRRGSPYASFREGITHRDARAISARDAAASREAADGAGENLAAATAGTSMAMAAPCFVGIKLFNSVMRDRGPTVLAHGILLATGTVLSAIAETGLEDLVSGGLDYARGAAAHCDILLKVVESP